MTHQNSSPKMAAPSVPMSTDEIRFTVDEINAMVACSLQGYHDPHISAVLGNAAAAIQQLSAEMGAAAAALQRLSSLAYAPDGKPHRDMVFEEAAKRGEAEDRLAEAVEVEREACARELETSYPDHAWLNAACAAIRSRVGG